MIQSASISRTRTKKLKNKTKTNNNKQKTHNLNSQQHTVVADLFKKVGVIKIKKQQQQQTDKVRKP